jgi:hypothetical protein
MFQVFKMFQRYVATVCIDVAKVDRDVAHVAMAIVYVSSVCSKCFICFIRMLQVFHLDAAKIDQDVAYICKCFKCFHMYGASVFIYMLQYLQWLHTCFHVFLVFYKYFRRMLQVFQLFRMYVASVSFKYCKSRSYVAQVEWDPLVAAACNMSRRSTRASGDTGDIRVARVPHGHTKRAGVGNGVQGNGLARVGIRPVI